MTSSTHDDVRDTTSKLPILPEIVQNRTESYVFPPPTPPSADHRIPSPATPVVRPQPSPGHLLSPRQLTAIPLILAGQTDEEVAQAVGVQRQAVNRWRHRHPRFIAELNRQRSLRLADTLDRYDRLLHRALGYLERFQDSYPNALEDQARLATQLLRSASRRTLARDPAAPPPPTDPTEIEYALLSQGLDPSPDDSPADDAPPPPPKKPRR